VATNAGSAGAKRDDGELGLPLHAVDDEVQTRHAAADLEDARIRVPSARLEGRLLSRGDSVAAELERRAAAEGLVGTMPVVP
jgi:hypothetical protein